MARAHLAGRIDTQGFQDAEVLDVDPERGALLDERLVLIRLRRDGGAAAAAAPGLAAVDSDFRIENHVEVVALVADALDGLVHAAGARYGLVDRLPELFQHLAELVVQFHGRGDYPLRFSKASSLLRTKFPDIILSLSSPPCVRPRLRNFSLPLP